GLRSPSLLAPSVHISGGLSKQNAKEKLEVTSKGIRLEDLVPLFNVFAPKAAELKLAGTLKPEFSVGHAQGGALAVGGTASLSGGNISLSEEFTIPDLDVSAAIDFSGDRVALSSFKGKGTVMDGVEVAVAGDDVVYELDSGLLTMPDMSVGLLGNAVNISGTVHKDGPSVELTARSDKVDIASIGPVLNKFAPEMIELKLGGIAKPNMLIAFGGQKELIAKGSVGLVDCKAQLADHSISDLNGNLAVQLDPETKVFKSEKLAFAYDKTPLVANFDTSLAGKTLRVKKLSVDGFSGTLGFSGDISLDEVTSFDGKVNATGIDSEQIRQALKPETKTHVTGTLKEAKGNIKGKLGNDLAQSLNGRLTLALEKGTIKDVNLAEVILKRVTGLSFLEGSLFDAIPRARLSDFEQDLTVVKRLAGTFDLSNGAATTSNLFLESTDFSLKSAGRIAYDANLKLDSTMFFTPEFSKDLVKKKEDLKYLLNEKDRLVFPLTISGQLPKPLVVPNLKGLVKTGAKNVIKREVTDLILDALGSKKDRK
ncbi:AsmA-like C-terminal region-containing protein, partial [Candidatus Hydrogenedentota bacterium]